MLQPLFSEVFSATVIHRMVHIHIKAEMYKMNENDPFVFDIINLLEKVRGKKKEPVRKPYNGMQILFRLKNGNRKLVVKNVKNEYREAELTENGIKVPCKLYWH
jgi:hypothetical protein